jgi:hypothetical protein
MGRANIDPRDRHYIQLEGSDENESLDASIRPNFVDDHPISRWRMPNSDSAWAIAFTAHILDHEYAVIGGGQMKSEHQPHTTPQPSNLTVFRPSRINDLSRRRCSLASAVKWPCR